MGARFRRGLAVLLLAWGAAMAAAGPGRLLHMLDYLAADYPEMVRDGRVLDEAEYAEQVEFATEVVRGIGRLPPDPRREALAAQAQALQAAVLAKAPGARVQGLARSLREALAEAYGVVTVPRAAPDPAAAARVFGARCVACHGPEGRGDGVLAAGLEPRPTDFTDRDRAAGRSVEGLYNTITFGVPGTGMPGFSELDEATRWALAFWVAARSATPAELARGQALWAADEARWRGVFADLGALVRAVPAAVREAHGADAEAVLAWLRTQPAQVAGAADPLAVTRAWLDRAWARLREGDREGAYEAALAAYLEGFELVEPRLQGHGAERRAVEEAMTALREGLRRGAAEDEVEAAMRRVREALDAAEAVLAGGEALGPGTAFVASLVILLREGLEAILIVAVIAATLVQAGRRDAMRWVHLGWIGALAAGGATWWLSTNVLRISGASREVTEGVTALLAVAVLLYVGFWLHSRTHADRWQRFLKERVHDALRGGALWALAGSVFLAVYREVFETILFYQALWSQGASEAAWALWAGLGAAAAALVVIAALILRFSVRLPLRVFFNVNAAILFVLALVFTGHGVAALQEAGWLPVDLLPLPRIELLGLYPTLETLAAQGLVLALGAGLLWHEARRGASA
ncbi:cytochrome c/FTR1 family iron permease [Inmirania thermothiophila]|uniref:High-affinity iron transporter n=1 Tax=Inmirania thermothiophila TaxID=1750597 RepID=A0A3N1Y0R0_9GAMM|nr:cytochrome c/FTR1 family iron permease [Inmirania thermothiophila]ROR32425.1 high-affinity iron transporter [Inmirania thermothiophila]